MKFRTSFPPVFLLGAGNLAHAIAHGLAKKNYPVTGWWARKTADISLPHQWDNHIICESINHIPAETAIVILAVSDSSITEVSRMIPKGSFLVCHCSGSIPAKELDSHQHYGVFYPLQTFTKDVLPEWSEIPIFPEANTNDGLQKLIDLSYELSTQCIPIGSEKRKILHLAAVISANFTNHLLYESSNLLKQEQLNFKWLKPLLEETIRKAFISENPALTQTGPAKRNDLKVMAEHLQLLEQNPRLQTIYHLISEAIPNQK